MVRRKNLGQEQGKGYKNILGNDKTIHSQSAKGIKQPTSINESQLNSMDKLNLKKEVVEHRIGNPNLTDEENSMGKISYMYDPDTNTSTNYVYDKFDGVESTKEKKGLWEKTKEFTKQKLKERKEQQFEAKAELLTDVKHPLTNKLNKQYDRVRTLEKHHEEAKDETHKEKLELKLKKEREQYREIQEEITKINVQDLSNTQLEQISIRYKDDSFFSFGDTNPYRTELLRRTEFKKVLDKDINDIKQKPIVKEEGLFDNLFN